jgi:hypothetical protein
MEILRTKSKFSAVFAAFSCAELHLRLIHTRHAAPMPSPCRAALIHTCHAVPLPCHAVLIHTCHAWRAPTILRQCRVLRESPRGSRKYPNCLSYSLTDWYASGNNLRGTRVVAGRIGNRAGRPHAVSGRPMLFHICHAMCLCCAHAALCRGLEKSLSDGMAVAWYGHGAGAAWNV